MISRCILLLWLITFWFGPIAYAHPEDYSQSIQNIKSSIVAIGAHQSGPQASNQFSFKGTGFAVATGNLIVTNAHVLATIANEDVIILQNHEGNIRFQKAIPVLTDTQHDLALLQIKGKLPPLKIAGTEYVPEGRQLLLTGYPIGKKIGLYQATHQAMISSIAPISLPPNQPHVSNKTNIASGTASELQLYQLDGTIFPGNSGGPLWDPKDGSVVGVVNMTIQKNGQDLIRNPSGISFAIPARHLQRLLHHLSARLALK